ncbi:hypothetical protein N2152v2_010598 [Parachlorella kessleri]
MDTLQTVFKGRECSAALARLASPSVLQALRSNASGAALDLLPPSDHTDTTSDAVAQVIQLVLEDVDQPDYPFSLPATDAGVEALRVLQRAVFGDSASSGGCQQSLMQAVLCGTLAQARRVLQLCVAALQDSLAPHNCLTIYSVAASCRCAPLEAAAASYAVRNFAAASQLDYSGLTGLSSASLMGFLRSDELQVSSELEVFAALVAWVERDPERRLHGFARRLAAAVRLSLLTLQDFEYVDSHPLVHKDTMALQVVAHAYLSKVTGSPYDTPFGLAACSRPRRGAGQQEVRQAQQLCVVKPEATAEWMLPQGSWPSEGQSALAELLEKLAREDCAVSAAAASTMDGASTPGMLARCTPEGDSSVPAAATPHLLVASTPSVRAAPGSCKLLQQQGRPLQPVRRALDLTATAAAAGPAIAAPGVARRTLQFSCSEHGAGSSSTVLLQELGGVTAKTSATDRQVPYSSNKSSRPGSMARLLGAELEMMLSPTKAGIKAWLDSATAALVPEGAASRKRLRYD